MAGILEYIPDQTDAIESEGHTITRASPLLQGTISR